MKRNKFEKGQAIVIIAISLIGLVAMAALIIDGGNAYLSRRDAQTAADAAALAGAREMCLADGTNASIYEAVEEYALTQNKGTEIIEFEIDIYREIHVTVSLTVDTFFAKVFNKPTTTVVATASSGCFSPGLGKGVLPVAWACKDIEGGIEWDSEDCAFKALDYETEFQPLLKYGSVTIGGVTYQTPFDFEKDMLPEIYVIMDTIALPEGSEGICFPDGVMVCDFDGDGRNDFLGRGDASWLDLDGDGGGASDMVDWIKDGFNDPIRIHTWVPSEPGDTVSGFHAAADEVGEIKVLPIFDQFCVGEPDAPENSYCMDIAHNHIPLPPGMTSDIVVYGTAQTYYHIIGFAYFYISCVDAPSHSPCPGHEKAVELGLIKHNVGTIEGYFITDVPPEFGAGGLIGVDVGAEVLSLTN
jgi:hypothetical protein